MSVRALAHSLAFKHHIKRSLLLFYIALSARGIKCTALISSAAAAINLWRTPPAASSMGDLAHQGANMCFYLHANSCSGGMARSRLLTSSANECFATKLLFCIITYYLCYANAFTHLGFLSQN